VVREPTGCWDNDGREVKIDDQKHDRVGAVVLNASVQYEDQHRLMLRRLIEERIDLLAYQSVLIVWP